MSEPETKGNSKPPGTFREVEGFDTKKNQPGSTARPDAGAVPPVDPMPEASAARPDGGHRKRRRIFNQPLSEPERAMSKDAEEQARQLKRKHRALYAADPRRFRKIVRLAQSAVFRQKPGPKPDRNAARRIAHAAPRRARGATWKELYQRFIPDYWEVECRNPRLCRRRPSQTSEQIPAKSQAAA